MSKSTALKTAHSAGRARGCTGGRRSTQSAPSRYKRARRRSLAPGRPRRRLDTDYGGVCGGPPRSLHGWLSRTLSLQIAQALRQRCSPLSSPLRFTSPRLAGGRLPRERVADSPYRLIVSHIMKTLGQVRSQNLHPMQKTNNPGGLAVK